MIFDSKDKNLAGVLVDRGTGQRIPFARWFDTDTGDYEAYDTPDGRDILRDELGVPQTKRGRAVGKLELLTMQDAVDLRLLVTTPKIAKTIDNAAGLEQYKRVYFDVWQWRGEARRCVNDHWSEYLAQSDFLDDLVIRRKSKEA